MKAIVPVAGFGNRLRPHTFTRPKVLLPVAGKPILGHIMDCLAPLPITETIFITGYMGEMIQGYVKSNYRMKTRFVKQKELLGLGHAVYQAAPYFDREPLLIILGDTIFDADLTELTSRPENTLCVKRVKDPSRFGVAVLKGKKIQKLVEKPKDRISNLALVGIYYLRDSLGLKKALEHIIKTKRTSHAEYQLTDALQLMIEQGFPMNVFPIEGWYDCGKPETLLDTNRFLLDHNREKAERRQIPGNVIIPPVYIDPTARINNSILGPHVSVGPQAHIANSIISDSLIGEGAIVRSCLLHESLVGNGAAIYGKRKKFNVGDASQIELA